MLRNQSIPAPTDMPPVEMVSQPIDWSAYMFEIDTNISTIYIGSMFCLWFVFFLFQQGIECWYAD